MMKYLPYLIVGGFILSAGIALAALTLNGSSFTPPATVTYNTTFTANGADLYMNGVSLPVCSEESVGIGASGNVWQQICGQGGSTSSTIGTYQLVQPTAVACASKTYAQCAAVNPNMPGTQEADFTIANATVIQELWQWITDD